MRLHTLHIQGVRDTLWPNRENTAWIYNILTDIIEYRLANNLDKKFPYVKLSVTSPEVLEYEVKKVAVIFETLRQEPTYADKMEFIDEFKRVYPATEVDEVLEEYFPELLLVQKSN